MALRFCVVVGRSNEKSRSDPVFLLQASGTEQNVVCFQDPNFRCDRAKFSVIRGIMFHGYGRSPGAVEVKSG